MDEDRLSRMVYANRRTRRGEIGRPGLTKLDCINRTSRKQRWKTMTGGQQSGNGGELRKVVHCATDSQPHPCVRGTRGR